MLTEEDRLTIVENGVLESTSWSEIVLKLAISGIELSYDVFLLFLYSIGVRNCRLPYMLLDEFCKSDQLDIFFKEAKTLVAIHAFGNNMVIDTICGRDLADKCRKCRNSYRREDRYGFNKQAPKIASEFFRITLSKFPMTVWQFYKLKRVSLPKDYPKFCSDLQKAYADLATAEHANEQLANDFAMISQTIAQDISDNQQKAIFLN